MHEATETLIGSAEAARILGKSPRTIHRLVKSGDLKPVYTAPGGQHGSYLFTRATVAALAAEHQDKAERAEARAG